MFISFAKLEVLARRSLQESPQWSVKKLQRFPFPVHFNPGVGILALSSDLCGVRALITSLGLVPLPFTATSTSTENTKPVSVTHTEVSESFKTTEMAAELLIAA